MISIEIKPAVGGDGGWLRASGHAEKSICGAVTAIEHCLAANLQNVWDVKTDGTMEDGRCRIWWGKADRKGKGLGRANLAAGFAYTGLKALAKEYPEAVTVRWIRPGGIQKKEEKRNDTY